MKVKRILKNSFLLLILPAIFLAGVIVGNTYNVMDILCPAKAYPHILESDFVSENEILFPKGTVIPVRDCAYMQRFNWQFAIDNATPLTPFNEQPEDDYGFSKLHPRSAGGSK